MVNKEVVKYNNNLNYVVFKGFNSVELDLFFSVCAKMKYQGHEKILFSFDELRNLSQYKPTSNSRFIEDLRRTNKKLMDLKFTVLEENKIIDFVLFPTFTIDTKENTLEVRTNSDFVDFLNALSSNFTRFDLEDFTKLDSKYSKTMFRILKQWRTVGFKEFSLDEFREMLDVPKVYKMANIDKKILEPILKELTPFFKNLSIRKVKKGRGGKVVGIEFSFGKENPAAAGKEAVKLPANKLFEPKDNPKQEKQIVTKSEFEKIKAKEWAKYPKTGNVKIDEAVFNMLMKANYEVVEVNQQDLFKASKK